MTSSPSPTGTPPSPVTLLLWVAPRNVTEPAEGLRILVSLAAMRQPVALRVLKECDSSFECARDESEDFDGYLRTLEELEEADVDLDALGAHEMLDAIAACGNVIRIGDTTRMSIPALLHADDSWIAWAREQDESTVRQLLLNAGQITR